MLTVDSNGLITVNTILNLNHYYLGVHDVTLRSSYSTTIYVDTSF